MTSFYILIFLLAFQWLSPSSNSPAKELPQIPTPTYTVPTVTAQGTEIRKLSSSEGQMSARPEQMSPLSNVTITSKSAIVVDVRSETVLWQKEPDLVLPIASLTKLMSALVFLQHNPGWKEIKEVTSEENRLGGARLHVRTGDMLTVEDLFYTAMTGSANNAMLAVIHATPLSEESFIAAMNEYASQWGLVRTHFIEPTGLEPGNVSTVSEFWKIARTTFSKPEIQRAATLSEHLLRTKARDEFHRIRPQNKILTSGLSVMGSKTGYTEEALYCLVTQVRHPELSGESPPSIFIVVLGAPSDDGRISDTKKLAAWTFKQYQW